MQVLAGLWQEARVFLALTRLDRGTLVATPTSVKPHGHWVHHTDLMPRPCIELSHNWLRQDDAGGDNGTSKNDADGG
eukprot:11206698-Lingulodinium_polyedra.AAC.1